MGPLELQVLAWHPLMALSELQALVPLMISSSTFVELLHSIIDLPLLAAAMETKVIPSWAPLNHTRAQTQTHTYIYIHTHAPGYPARQPGSYTRDTHAKTHTDTRTHARTAHRDTRVAVSMSKLWLNILHPRPPLQLPRGACCLHCER